MGVLGGWSGFVLDLDIVGSWVLVRGGVVDLWLVYVVVRVVVIGLYVVVCIWFY